MNNPKPRDSAQLPPLPDTVAAFRDKGTFTMPEQFYPADVIDAREALRAQAASVEAVGGHRCIACAMRDRAIGQPPDQSVTPAYLEWLATKSRSCGVAGNEAWNAGVAWKASQTTPADVEALWSGVAAIKSDLHEQMAVDSGRTEPPQAPQAVGRAQIAIYERLLPLIATCLKHQQVNSASELMRQLDGEIAALATKGQRHG